MTRRRYRSILALLALLALPACADAPAPRAAAVAATPPTAPTPEARVWHLDLKTKGGTHVVPVAFTPPGREQICCFWFIVDSGAADVSLSPRLFIAMRAAGLIPDENLIDIQRYSTANGIVEGIRFRMPPMELAGVTVRNVIGSVSKGGPDDQLLLGQSFLQKFRFWAIDNRTGQLVLGG